MRREFKSPRLMASGDVRKLLGVSYQFVEQLVDSGKLPFFQTSCGRIFRQSDVLQVKNSRIQKAKTDKRIKLKK